MWDRLTSLTSDNWQAIGSMGTLAVAVVAALFAKRQVDESRRVREDQSQPQVVVDLETHNILILLTIQNSGTTAARDVQIKFDPPLQSTLIESGRTEMLTSKLLAGGIPTMPPGKVFKLLFEDGPAWYKRDDLPHSYEAVVTFTDGQKKKRYEYRYVLDFDILYGWRTISVYGLHEVANALKNIERSVAKWTNNRGLRVSVHDGDKRDREDLQYVREMQDAKRRERNRRRLP